MQTPVIISAAIAEQSEAATRFLGRHPVRGRREATRIYELLDLCDDVSRRAVEANSEQFSAIADQIGIEPAVDTCAKLELYVEQNPLDRVAARILFIMKNFGIYAAQGR
jgi:hypothetical protein